MKIKKTFLSTFIVLLFCTFLICATSFTLDYKKVQAEELNLLIVGETYTYEEEGAVAEFTIKGDNLYSCIAERDGTVLSFNGTYLYNKGIVSFYVADVLFCEYTLGEGNALIYYEREKGTEDIDELKKVINELRAKLNESLYTAKSKWETKILPSIISSVVSAIIAVILSCLFGKKKFKWKNKYDQCASAYNEREKNLKDFKKILEESNISNDLKELESNYKIGIEEIRQTKENIAEIKKMVLNLKSGALQAWAECPDAVRELSSTKNKEEGKNE